MKDKSTLKKKTKNVTDTVESRYRGQKMRTFSFKNYVVDLMGFSTFLQKVDDFVSGREQARPSPKKSSCRMHKIPTFTCTEFNP